MAMAIARIAVLVAAYAVLAVAYLALLINLAIDLAIREFALLFVPAKLRPKIRRQNPVVPQLP